MRSRWMPVVVTLTALGGPVLCHAQSADLKSVLLPKLNSQFVLTKMSADGNDVVTAGTAVTLQKDGLQMCSVQAVIPLDNTYKNGKLSAGRFAWGIAMSLAQPSLPISNVPMRTFVAGEKFWVSMTDVQKSYVILKVYSDVYDNVRYYAQIVIPFNKKQPPSPDDLLKTLAEVVTGEAAPAEQAAASPQEPPPAPAQAPESKFPPVAPPPPPPDAVAPPPATVSQGQTEQQVIDALGQPKSRSKVGTKTILTYPNLKVVLLNGKVSDVQ